MLCYLFHHSDFYGHFDESKGSIRQIDMNTLSIDIDVPIDNRSTWFFKGLSTSTVNYLLQSLSCQSDVTFENLSENAIRALTVPYDDMSFSVGDENLQVVYSIKDIESSPFRRCIVGPHEVQLYEKGIPHFGPIIVYKSKSREKEKDDGSLEIVHELQNIESSTTDILKAISVLNFG